MSTASVPDVEFNIDPTSEVRLPKQLHGKGHGRVTIGAGSKVDFNRLSIIGDDLDIFIGEDCLIRAASLAIRGEGLRLHIGHNFRCAGTILNAYGADLIIGDDVLFSSKISVRTWDMHKIIDTKTGEQINPPAPVTIEDHVWIGEGVKIMSGVNVGRDSVVGIGTIVTGDVPSGSVFAGVPGRVIREGVTWRR